MFQFVIEKISLFIGTVLHKLKALVKNKITRFPDNVIKNKPKENLNKGEKYVSFNRNG